MLCLIHYSVLGGLGKRHTLSCECFDHGHNYSLIGCMIDDYFKISLKLARVAQITRQVIIDVYVRAS